MTRYPNNEQRGDQHIDNQPDLAETTSAMSDESTRTDADEAAEERQLNEKKAVQNLIDREYEAEVKRRALAYQKLVGALRMWRNAIEACNLRDGWTPEMNHSDALLRELGELEE